MKAQGSFQNKNFKFISIVTNEWSFDHAVHANDIQTASSNNDSDHQLTIITCTLIANLRKIREEERGKRRRRKKEKKQNC